MKDIRNSIGKLICRADKDKKSIEIAVKGCITVICFTDDGKLEIKNINRTR